MLQLRELDLQLTFVTASALREDIENQTRAIDNAALEFAFEVALLAWRERVIKQHDFGFMRGHRCLEFFELARAHKITRRRLAAATGNNCDRLRACRKCEFFELYDVICFTIVIDLQVNKKGYLSRVGAIEKQSKSLGLGLVADFVAVDLSVVFARVKRRNLDHARRHDCRNCVLVNHLTDGVL